MAMHPNFPDWYRSAALTPQAEVVDARWAAIEDIAKQPTGALVIELARLFTVPSSTEEHVPPEFREALRKRDTTFPLRDNLQELRVLAGAALRHIVEQRGTLSPLTALASVCGSFGPRQSATPELDHIVAAQKFLIAYSREVRLAPSPTQIKIPSFTKAKFGKTLSEGLFGNPPTGLRDPLLDVLTEIGSGSSTALEQAQRAIEQLARGAAVREEEVAILWWLHSRFSKRVEKPFSETGYLAGTFLFPLEVADLTVFVPGSDSVAAVIVQVLQFAGVPSSAEPMTIANATNSLSRDLRERAVAESKSDVPNALTPVLLAIQKSLETDGPEEWFPVYRRACDIPVDRPFPIAHLSMQLFHERMLVRAAAEAK